MSKYGEIVALLDWATKMKTPDKTTRKRKKLYDFDDVDLIALLRKKQQEAKMLEDFLKDHEKLHKKEEKKDEKKSALSVIQITMLLLASFPIAAPLYVTWIKTVLESLK